MNTYDTNFYNQYLKKSIPKGFLLWVDDLREVPGEYERDYRVVIARSYYEAIEALYKFKYDVICLDHDLGEALTGYDICKYIITHHIECPEYRIHTSNPVGRDNMAQLLEKNTDSIIRIM